MPKQRLESLREKFKGRLSFSKRPVPTSQGIPSAPLEGSPTPGPSQRSSTEPSSDSQRRPGGTFDIFIDGAGPPQTTANLAGDMTYKGAKALLVVLDTVGYAHPAMKAAAAGLSRVVKVIDVCTAPSQWVTVPELITLMRQNVVQNKADYDTIRHTLEAIVSMAENHRQDGSQRSLDRRVEELAMCLVL